MKTLSVRQPWAWLIVNGYKTVENRTWKTTYRGSLLIHASLTPALSTDDLARLRADLHQQCGIDIPATLPVGGIIGQVDLVDCVTTCTDPVDDSWHEPGQFAYLLRHARCLPFRPVKGKLHFFDVD